jgi:uncharacterized membrane protein YphA (DoxX/SURF4 family)
MGTIGAQERSSATVVALLLIQVCIGYEWLVSGLTKIVHADFPAGIAAELRQMSKAAPAWYRSFLDGAVIPHAVAFGYAVEIAEVAIGIVLLLAVLRLPSRLGRYTPPAMAAALVVGIVLALNFALANGSSFGLRLAQDSFDEGVDLDTLLVGLQLALLVYTLAPVRCVRRQFPISNSRTTSFSDTDELRDHRTRTRALNPLERRQLGLDVILQEQDGTTRLVSRNRFRLPRLKDKLAMIPMEPGSLLMERTMLQGIKRRAEKLAKQKESVDA